MTSEVKFLDPFSFWPSYRSALQGLGGDAAGPDPSYCFHTVYQEFRPGSVTFRMVLVGARATSGELEFRINAYRPESGMDAILVASVRASLEAVEQNLEVPVRIAALPGVTYAVFCRHTEPSDLVVERIDISVEESEDDDVETYASEHLGRSRFGIEGDETPSLMVTVGEPVLAFPRSQPFTHAQLAAGDAGQSLPAEILKIDEVHDRWRAAFAYQAIRSYGFLEHGACGLLALDRPVPLSDVLAKSGCLIALDEVPSLRGPFDFVTRDLSGTDVTSDQALAHAILVALKPLFAGGLGIFFFHYRPEEDSATGTDEGGQTLPDRQCLQRTVLRLIGHGCGVGQLCLPDAQLRPPGVAGVPFAMIVRR